MKKKPTVAPHNVFNTQSLETQTREVTFVTPTHAVSVKSSYCKDSLKYVRTTALNVLKEVKKE